MKRNRRNNSEDGIFGSKLYQGMTTFSNLVVVSMLWLFTSIPIITIGASTAALYESVVKVIQKDEGNMTRTYFHIFRKCFLRCLVPGIIFVFYGIVMAVDCYNYIGKHGYYTLPLPAWLIVVVVLSLFSMFLFPIMARTGRSFIASLGIATSKMIHNGKVTLRVLLILLVTFFCAWLFLPAIIILPGAMALACSRLEGEMK